MGDCTEAVETLAGLIDSLRLTHPVRVAVDGPDAAGKTTLADAIGRSLEARNRTVIRASVDGFHRPRVERHQRGPYSPEGYYRDSFDYDALRRHLLDPLGPGGDRVYRTATFDYLRDTEELGTTGLASSDAIVVVDGVFLLRPELASAWDYRVFVSVSSEETLRRALVRDLAVFGSVDEVERRYRERYLPAHELYLAEARPVELADVVVANDLVAEAVISGASAPRKGASPGRGA